MNKFMPKANFWTILASEILSAGTAYKVTNDVIDLITEHFKGKLEKIDYLSYQNLLERILAIRPEYPESKRAVIIKNFHDDGDKKLIFLFLDMQDQIIRYPNGSFYGKIIIIKKLDREIEDAFGNTNILLVE